MERRFHLERLVRFEACRTRWIFGWADFKPQRREERREDKGKVMETYKSAIYKFCDCTYGGWMTLNELTHEIIGAAIEVHRELGPGKKEAAYEHALVYELGLRGLPHLVQKPLPVVYKGLKLDCGYRLDVLVQNLVVVEAKSLEE